MLVPGGARLVGLRYRELQRDCIFPSVRTLLGAGLDLFRPDRETWLVNRAATYAGVSDASACPAVPELLVDSENPEESLILEKIEGRQSCGLREPMVGELADADQQCITDWVLWLANEPM